jgi:hypothetical protein
MNARLTASTMPSVAAHLPRQPAAKSGNNASAQPCTTVLPDEFHIFPSFPLFLPFPSFHFFFFLLYILRSFWGFVPGHFFSWGSQGCEKAAGVMEMPQLPRTRPG